LKILNRKYKFPPLKEGKSIDVWLGKYKISQGIISKKNAKEKFRKIRKASKKNKSPQE